MQIGLLDTYFNPQSSILQSRLARIVYFDTNGKVIRKEGTIKKFDLHGSHNACELMRNSESQTALYAACFKEEGNIILSTLKAMDYLLNFDLKIICMPIGLHLPNPFYKWAIDKFEEKNVLAVCAVGNKGEGKAVSLATYPNILSVGSVNVNNIVSNSSGSYIFNDECLKPEILTLGEQIVSVNEYGITTTLSGSSMACIQLVKGIIEIMLQFPNISAKEIKHYIFLNADYSEINKNRSAYGVFNLERTLFALQKVDSNETDRLKHNTHSTFQLPFIDENLIYELKWRKEEDLIETVFVALEEDNSLKIIQNLQDKIIFFEKFKNTNMVLIRAKKDFYRNFIHNEEIQYLSSTYVGRLSKNYHLI